LLAFTGRSWQGQEPAVAARGGEHRIHFRARNGLIFIPARVNGNPVTLLLDTGAVLTTFSSKIVPERNRNSQITINMANGSVSASRVPVAFTVGELELQERRCSFRQSVVVGDFKFGEADGVIGLDVLSSFRVVTIDFQNSILLLEDP
jgi:predicted aspartyl protease